MSKLIILIGGLSLLLTAYDLQAKTCGSLFNMNDTSQLTLTKTEKNKSQDNKKKSNQNRTPITEWTLENGSYPDFTKIKASDLLVTADQAIQETRDIVTKIKTVETPTFENVIEPLEFNDLKMKKFDGLFGMMYSSFKDAAFKEVEETIMKKTDALDTEMWMDQAFYEKVEAIYKIKDSLAVDQKRLVEKYRDAFINNGLNLDGEKKKKFVSNKEELMLLENKYLNNLSKNKSEFKLLIEDKEELNGLSEAILSKLQANAAKEGKSGYLINLEPSVYLEVMEKATNREIRKKLYIANGTLAYKSGETDNSSVVKRISELRQEQSELLGFKHYSEYSLRNKMALNVETVNDLINRLIKIYKPYALKEEQELNDFVHSKGVREKLEPWDRAYWVEKLLNEKYSFNEDAIKEYLEYGKVQSAVFQLAGQLYGLKFVERNDLPKMDADMQVFEVRNKDNELMSYFIVDPFARMETKSPGAWASRIHPVYKINGKRVVPIVTNTTNFTKPENGKPFLLKVDEAITVFHEFGHALHSILSQARYPSQSATAVARDFVELPSQFMENFFYEKEVLKMFAFHYKTNELIPDSLIDSIVKFKQFRSANAGLRQFGLSLIDFSWHTGEAMKMNESILDIEQRILAPVMIYSDTSGTVMSTKFTHIFNGGYSSAYYSYKWAEVLDADAFSVFKKEGLFNPDTAARFMKFILETGGSRDPMELYIEFAGRKPDIDAMLERDGLKEN